MCSLWDADYVHALVKHVVTTILDTQGDSIRLGAKEIPVPPQSMGKCKQKMTFTH